MCCLLSVSKARLHLWEIKPYERISTNNTPCSCCLSLSSRTSLPQKCSVPATRPLVLGGGGKSNFTNHTCNRLFMQVGWRALRCVYTFERTCHMDVSNKGEASMHTHMHVLLWGGWKEMCVCLCLAFHLTEGHQWVTLLKSTLGYLCCWHARSGCLGARLTGQCLMLHNWFYWPAQPAGCQCWFEAWQLRLTTTAVLPGLLLWIVTNV